MLMNLPVCGQEILEMDNIEEIKDKLKELAKSKFIKL